MIESCSAEDMKNMKKFGLFLVAVKAFNNQIFVGNINGDILVYNNPLSTNKT